MASNGSGHQVPNDGQEDGDDLPTSHLTRPTPDAILADEADENALLGVESDSEGGSSRPVSMSSPPADRTSKRASQMLTTPEKPVSDETPTQSTFASKRASLRPPIPYKTGPSEADLQAQVADLTNQVTGLNAKLVTSFMRISDLEDDISDKHEQLSRCQEKISKLEKEREEHLAALNTGLLVEKAHVSSEMQKMMERVIDETAQRGKAISDKEKIEAELDELSSSLFSEANKMVAVERLARARAEEKSRSMEERLKDTEEIMEHQQKRLVELQGVVERNNQKSQETDKQASQSGGTLDAQEKIGTFAQDEPLSVLEERQLRLDVVPYTELRAFLNHLRKLRLQLAPFYTYPLTGPTPAAAGSSVSSPFGSRTGSPAPVTGTSGANGQIGNTSVSPFVIAGVSRHRDFPSLPSTADQLVHLPSHISSIGFLKRMNEEDCEPCLRLDIAPGLNWLSRRQMHTSILEGNLIIEPVFGGGIFDEEVVRTKFANAPPAACAMCGKAVVNVSLPNTTSAAEGSTWMSAAGQAASSLQASVTSSMREREPSGSPPPTSTPFFGGASDQSGGARQKKGSSGLFSTLRNIGSNSPRPSISPSTSSTLIASSSHGDAQQQGVEEDPFARRQPPIPTHIFRISETAIARYLLCPDYCLRRLRVTCEFWAYIRHLERAVVLEGKLAWDDEPIVNDTETPKEDLLPPGVPEKTGSDAHQDEEMTHTVEATSGHAEEQEKEAEDAAGSNSKSSPVEKARTDEEQDHQVPESDTEDRGEGDDRVSQKAKRLSAAESGTEDGEDGFADAQSIASSGVEDAASTEQPDGTNDKGGEEEEARKNVGKEEDSGERGEEEAMGEDTPQVETANLPPLPPRPDQTRPPALPPRPPSTSQVAVDLGPEPRRLLPSKGDKQLTWEEKVWLEVMRHKADMWAARLGVLKDG